MSRRRTIAAAAALFCAAGGCETSGRSTAPPSASEPLARETQLVSAARPALADADIAAAVHRRLGSELASADVTVQDGIVSLQGRAPHLLAVDRATRIALGTRGVRAVSNRIVLEPTERTDREIMMDVEDALRLDPATEAMNIDVEVESGEVTLRGTVESEAEREMVERIAKSVRGTRSVEDLVVVDTSDLEVEWWRGAGRSGPADVTPEAIVQAVIDAMRIDPRVDHDTIDVSATGTVVRLSGTVDDERAKLAAEELARSTLGVSAVGNDIVVTEARIQDNLVWSVDVEAADVRVNVIEGAATLTGRVDTWAERDAAVAAAYAGGATTVIDELRVGSAP